MSTPLDLMTGSEIQGRVAVGIPVEVWDDETGWHELSAAAVSHLPLAGRIIARPKKVLTPRTTFVATPWNAREDECTESL